MAERKENVTRKGKAEGGLEVEFFFLSSSIRRRESRDHLRPPPRPVLAPREIDQSVRRGERDEDASTTIKLALARIVAVAFCGERNCGGGKKNEEKSEL